MGGNHSHLKAGGCKSMMFYFEKCSLEVGSQRSHLYKPKEWACVKHFVASSNGMQVLKTPNNLDVVMWGATKDTI